jgi:LPXTG-motif cell wall-anchored protein
MRKKLSRGMVVAAAATGILPMYGIQAYAVSHSEVSASACGESSGVQAAVDPSYGDSCTSGPASGSGDDRKHDGYDRDSGDVDKAGYGDAGKDEGAGGDSKTPGDQGDASSTQHSAAPPVQTTPLTSSATTGEESGYGDDDADHGHDESGYGEGDSDDDNGYGHDESGYGEEEGGYGDTPTEKPPTETKPPTSPSTTPPKETEPPTTPPASSPPHTEPPTEPPSLPETGSDQQVLAASGVAALLLTSGAVLYRRGRAASRR